MAPELLDGAANLRQSEASLKQIDVYSLGLVLWELATRCEDLYHGISQEMFQSTVGSIIFKAINFEICGCRENHSFMNMQVPGQ